MTRGPRFVEVPADRLLATLRSISAAVAGAGGHAAEGVQGREVFFDLRPNHAVATVRVYTSLAVGADQARECGEDAVRLVLLGAGRPLAGSEKILRTAPASAPDRVQVFLDRLTQKIRDAYAVARKVPGCPACGLPMARRQSKHGSFYGCCQYPTCKGTRAIRPEESQS